MKIEWLYEAQAEYSELLTYDRNNVGQTIYIYHLADARTNYMYHIFGVES